ncbi:uncharacterized protein LOC114875799 [Osmia bicornis bicornis]|uniref:uncharacterized protein LOC114875799 n=1 Tax=Osmia bicornis bicornis TaxID=1437191 RepID=UPI001EAEEF66|nr:uncharacterized protein LOC114875799 [Osmia bicornis bicornis]
MSSNKIESYDVSQKMREIIEWKDARKKALRERYLREIHRPTKQKLVIDDAVHRYNILKLTQEYHTQVTGKAFMVWGLVVLGLVGFAGLFVKEKSRQERLIRTGKVSYADRQFKFT